ncbi:MAG: tetratricopeptide repeat protein [Bacteroidota bacterium]
MILGLFYVDGQANIHAKSRTTLDTSLVQHYLKASKNTKSDSASWFIKQAKTLVDAHPNEFFYQGQVLMHCGIYQHKRNNFQAAIDTFDLAIKRFVMADNQNQLALCHHKKALSLYRMGQFEEAIQVYQHVIDLTEVLGDSTLLSYSKVNIGSAYRKLGFYGRSMHHTIQAAEIMKQLGRTADAGTVYLNVGNDFKQLKDYEKALEYFLRADSACIQKNCSDNGRGLCRSSIAAAYFDLEQYDSAGIYFQQADSLIRRGGQFNHLWTNYYHWTLLHIEEGNIEQALSDAQNSLRYSRKVNDPYGIMRSHVAIGKAYYAAGNYKNSLVHLDSAKTLESQLSGDNSYHTIQQDIAKTYEKLGQYDLAFQALHEAIAKDAAAYREGDKAMRDIDRELFAKLKQQDEEPHLHQLAILERSRKRRFLLIISLTLGVLGLGGIGFLQFRRQRFSRQAKQGMDVLEKTKLAHLTEEKQWLENELENKRRDMTRFTERMLHKQQVMEDLQEQTASLHSKVATGSLQNLEQLTEKLQNDLKEDNDWEEFTARFDVVYEGFRHQLQQRFPKLSTKDIRLCALLRLNLNSKEIASLLHIGHGSVNTARYRLRKKLELEGEQDLIGFLLKI